MSLRTRRLMFRLFSVSWGYAFIAIFALSIVLFVGCFLVTVIAKIWHLLPSSGQLVFGQVFGMRLDSIFGWAPIALIYRIIATFLVIDLIPAMTFRCLYNISHINMIANETPAPNDNTSKIEVSRAIKFPKLARPHRRAWFSWRSRAS